MVYKYVYVYKWRSNVEKLFDLFTPTTADAIEFYHLLTTVSSLETLGAVLVSSVEHCRSERAIMMPTFALAITKVHQVYLHRVGYGIES